MNKKIFKNEYIFSIITKILMVLVSFGEQILIAKFLGASLKGDVSYIQSIISIVTIICVFGLHHSYAIYRKEKGCSENSVNIFLSGVLFLFVFYSLLSGVICILFKDISLLYICLFSILVGLSNIIGYIFLVENPNKRNLETFLLSLIEVCFYIFVFFVLSPSVLLGLLMLYGIEIIKGVVFLIQLKFKPSLKKETFIVLLSQMKIGFFPMVSLLLTNLNYKLDIIMLSNSANVSSDEVGVYSVAIAIAEKSLLVADAMKEILVSKLAKGSDKNEVIKINRIAFCITFILALLVVMFCPIVINIFFGNEYKGAISLIRITSLSTCFMVIFKMIGSYNIVQHKQVLNAIFLLISVVINFIFNFIFIPIYGVMGAAIATIIGFISCGTIFMIYFCISEKTNPIDLVLIKKEDIYFLKNIFGGEKNKRC